MKRKLANVYAVFCLLLLVAGFLTAAIFAWKGGAEDILSLFVGILASLVFAPILHEVGGHLAFGFAADFECAYSKFFCFEIYEKQGKKRFGFASPFAAEQTQMRPKRGGDMKRRAYAYTMGGLVVSGVAFVALSAAAILCSALGVTRYTFWGAVPYLGYLFLLNVIPLEYVSGKTDALVLRGIRKGYAAEKNMLAAMEIQGQLYEGKTFAEIDKALYFDLPQLPEDEPLYAVLLDLRYRYCLDVEDLEGAADCLNRLARSQEYLPVKEVEKLASELVYMHALRGDLESAEASGKLCQDYLTSESPSAKRILAAFSLAFGKTEAVEPLKAQAKVLLEYERVEGLKKWEEKLLERIKIEN